MTDRKKRLIFFQITLLILGILIIFFTYSNQQKYSSKKIIPKETQEKIQIQLADPNQKGDVFYNIEYSGLDLAGNRYILKSKEAYNNPFNLETVSLKSVDAVFYFKDDTILYVSSEEGVYNNKTLDMIFIGNVKAKYEDSKLFARRAEYSNSKSLLTVTEKVKVIDERGTVFADKLFFDIKKQTLDISSFNKSKVNANLNLE